MGIPGDEELGAGGRAKRDGVDAVIGDATREGNKLRHAAPRAPRPLSALRSRPNFPNTTAWEGGGGMGRRRAQGGKGEDGGR